MNERNEKLEKLTLMAVDTVVSSATLDKGVNPSYLYKESHCRNKTF